MMQQHGPVSVLRERGLWVARCSCGHATDPCIDKTQAALQHMAHRTQADMPPAVLSCGCPIGYWEEMYQDGPERWCPTHQRWSVHPDYVEVQ